MVMSVPQSDEIFEKLFSSLKVKCLDIVLLKASTPRSQCAERYFSRYSLSRLSVYIPHIGVD